MKKFRKVFAVLMVAVMAFTVLSTTAFAASRRTYSSDRLVSLAKDSIEGIDTDDLYTGSVSDPVIVYYASQPFSAPFAIANYAMNRNNRNKPTFQGRAQDLTVGIVSSLAGFYAKNYASKTLSTLQDSSKDIADGLENAPDELVGKAAKRAPIVSQIYNMTGPVGKVTIQAILFPGYLATNAGALAFVIAGGSAALLVIFGLSGILSPGLAVKEGPQAIDQFFRDINEMDQALKAVK
ncbi:MAG: hypothetical protein J6T17_02460 [Clostridia bacterium]|nr:hypothetical protein [Clostridia bacterium]